jgi:hypothetical protein
MKRLLLLLALLACPFATAQTGPNLVVNPGADAGAGAPSGYETVTVPAWVGSGTFTAVPWSVGGGFPLVTDPGPPDRGANFFSGGAAAPVSTGAQTADLASHAGWIDAGSAGYELAGWFGGFASQEDRAKLSADFKSAGGATLGTVTIGDVTATERANATGLLYRVATGLVPVGTRSVQLTITMTRFAGSYNDGYADSLSLRLGSVANAAALGTGCGGTSATPTLATSAPHLGLPFAIAVTGVAANAAGELLVSAPPASALPLGGGCFVFLDLGSLLSLSPIVTNASGAWNVGFGLPGDPGLSGLQVVAQAYVAPGTGPFGLDLTNGVLWTVGF